jgi:hypothetical protein
MRREFFQRLGLLLGRLAQSDLSDSQSWVTAVGETLSDYTFVVAQINHQQAAKAASLEEDM